MYRSRFTLAVFSMSLLLLYGHYSHAQSQLTDTIVSPPNPGVAILFPNEPLDIECLLSSDVGAKFKWYKRNLNEEELYELNPNNRTKISSRRLILNDTTRDDVGDYVCRTYNEQAPNNIEEALIHVRLDHLVAISGVEISHSDNTSVVYEGQRVELFCGPVNGDLQVTSYWRSSPSADPFAGGSQMIQELGSEPRIGEKRPSLYAIKVENYGKKLIIDPIGMEHRQYYVCSVQNPIATIHRKQIFLRVHGRLVALWPALGITVEIFVFLLILYCTTIRSAVKIKTKEAVNNCKCIAKLPVNPREKANGDITNQLLLSNRV